MLTKGDIEHGLELLSERLAHMGVVGELLLCGGAVMCLVFNARDATKDVDAIFEPSAEMRSAAAHVAKELGWPTDWLNDAAKGYFSPRLNKTEVRSWPNLRVYAPTPDYMLAMKCMAARFDSSDQDDVLFLVKFLALEAPDEVFDLIEDFYPRNLIPPKTKFFIEELMEKVGQGQG